MAEIQLKAAAAGVELDWEFAVWVASNVPVPGPFADVIIEDVRSGCLLKPFLKGDRKTSEMAAKCRRWLYYSG